MERNLDTMTPLEIVRELDKYIIGQDRAKRIVAIALRNRMRRKQLPEDLREEIAPKNIIMIGPTGVGKTEIARRLSKLCGAPFIKVEATKYTEVGYVGRDVESMVRDLMSVAMSMVKSELQEGVKEEAERRTEETLLDILLPGLKKKEGVKPHPVDDGIPLLESVDEPAENPTREKFRAMLKDGKLEDKLVEVSVSKPGMPTIEVFAGSNFEEMDLNLGNIGGIGNIFGSKKKKKTTTVKAARQIIMAEEMDKLIDSDRVTEIARERVEEMGIIFIDEIDKVAARSGHSQDVSREGVQRDILPIVEGSKVNTKYGIVDTSHILFIAAGAFHISKPSDLIPELQGRFPLRVELTDLTAEDFQRILTQPQNALTFQYTALLGVEDVSLEFTEEATKRLSEIAAEVNQKSENIGARRLHTILENLLEEVSFNAPEIRGQKIVITPEYVDERLGEIVKDQDLSRYIL
ncbi:MAG: ATP-dependent protease ATPase subunit HslU [Spirochaetales bacterium]|nr:ATP-dependent protease ATPase subunit HslU [Spirochaetales bacterium]